MNDDDTGASASRWSVALVGVLLVALPLGDLLLRGVAAGLLQTVLPTALAGVVTAVGVALVRSDLRPEEVRLVATFAVVGAALTAPVGVATLALSLPDQPTMDSLLFVFEVSAGIGGVGGVAVGYFFVGERRAGKEASRARHSVETLYAASSRLTRADTEAAVAEAAIAIAVDVIDVPFALLWTHDVEADVLRPYAASEAVDDLGVDQPTLDGETVGYDAFDRGETVLLEDAAAGPAAAEAAGLEAVLYVPVEEWGVLGVGTRDPTGFTDLDQRLVGLLARQTAAELDRVEREQRLSHQRQRLRTIVENLPVILFTFDETGEFTLSEGKALSALGLEPGGLVGMDVREAYADYPDLLRAVEQALEGESVNTRLEVADTVFDTWYEPVRDAEGALEQVIGVAIDVTEREWRREAIESLYAASEQMATAETAQGIAEITVALLDKVLDRPLTVYLSWDEEHGRLVPMVRSSDAEALVADRPELPAELLAAGSPLVGAFRSGATHVVRDPAETGYLPEDRAFPAVMFVPVQDHGMLAIVDQSDGFTEDERTVVNLLARETAADMDRAEREGQLRRRQAVIESLHDATREMMILSEAEDVCQVAVGSTRDILELPIAAVFLRDESGDRLEPVAWTEESADLFGGLPTFERDDGSLAWQVYESGEYEVYDGVRGSTDIYNPETPIESEAIVPLDGRGVFVVGSTDRGPFDRDDLDVVRLLAANVETALERAERESELRTRNSQMEFFNSILRHDVLNGMTVIRARAEMIADGADGETAEYAETILDWSDDVTDIIEHVREVLNTLTGEEPVETRPVDAAAVLRSEVDRVRTTYPDVVFDVDVEAVTVVADELLAEVYGNLVTNAVEHNDAADPRIHVSLAEVGDRAVLRVEDNGSGIPAEMREAVFRRGETGHAKSTGSGFGLFFVDVMVDAYGGDIRIEESYMGGAAFVVELPVAGD